MQTFKLGRLRPAAPGPRLLLKDYLAPTLPASPATCDYSGPASEALLQVYENDTLGDCVIAAMCHATGVFTGNSRSDSSMVYNTAEVIHLYSAIGGYVPGDPSTDQGCLVTGMLNHWMRHGAPIRHNKIRAWMSVDAAEPEEFRTALWLFENLIFGIELPDAWITPFPSASGFTWDYAGQPDPDNGHCVLGTGYTPSGVTISTWGMLGEMTNKAIEQYAGVAGGGELYAVLSPEIIIAAQQKAPNGVNWDQLLSDFDAMSGE